MQLDDMYDQDQGNESGSTRSSDRQYKLTSNLLIYLHDLVHLMGGIILILLLLFRVVVVSGPSMNSTLIDGDYLILLNNTFYQNPKQGDIIVASKLSYDNGTPIVKRIIATEGQTVDIDFSAGKVFVDGILLEEEYTYTPTNQYEGIDFPLTVDPGCVFVLGDNRNISKDSRSPEIGLIDTREILGKAIFLLLPGTAKGTISRQYYRIGALN